MMIELIVGVIVFIALIFVLYLIAPDIEIFIFMLAVLAVIICPIMAILNIFPWVNIVILFITMCVCLGMCLGGEDWRL